jgi:hypothetical protein
MTRHSRAPRGSIYRLDVSPLAARLGPPRPRRARWAAPIAATLALSHGVRADALPSLRANIVIEAGASAEPSALMASIAELLRSELGRPVTLVPAADCADDCLRVVLSASSVTERFSPGASAPRQRTVDITGDPSLALEAVAFLAGNLVRDEADALLATLPPAVGPARASAPPALAPPPAAVAATLTAAPPAAGSAAAVVATAATAGAEDSGPPAVAALAPPPHVTASLGLVPFLSTDWTQVGQIDHDYSFDVLVGMSAGSHVLSISGVADVEVGVVSGGQLAGVVATSRTLRGLQIGGVAALATEVRGTQLGGVITVGTDVRGVQLGGVAALASRSTGTQVAGVAAVSGGSAAFQLGGVASVARGSAATQIAGVANVARVAHTQVAGVVNVAGRLEGAQVGVINVAGKVEGVQLGVINVGGGNDGVSLGLINIIPGGRTDLEASIDSKAIGAVMLRHGSRRWHNVYGVGGQQVQQDLVPGNEDVWMYGLGFGPTWQRGDTRFDLDLIGWQVNYGARHSDELSLLGQLRLSVAQPVGPVTLVVGGAFNSFVSTDERQPFLARSTSPAPSNDVVVKNWLSAFVGVRI